VREFYERVGLRYWGPQELFPPKMTIARAADALARIPALHHPGEKFTYGFNTDLLGRLIEIWVGESLARYLQRAVFEPLGMVDTGFSVPAEKRARFTSCSTLSEGKLAVVDPAGSSPFNGGFEFLSGGGGLVSTVRDYANFCQMLVDGGQFKGRRLLKPDTLRLMFEDQLHGWMAPTDSAWVSGLTKSSSARVPGNTKRRVTVGRLRQHAVRRGAGGAAVPDLRTAAGSLYRNVGEKAVRDHLCRTALDLDCGDSANWPQFRGPNGQGVAPAARIPVHFGPGTNVLWKLAIPPGHSSPVIWSNRLFLTATETGSPQALLTLAIDPPGRPTPVATAGGNPNGRVPSTPLNNAASSTPAADAPAGLRLFRNSGTYLLRPCRNPAVGAPTRHPEEQVRDGNVAHSLPRHRHPGSGQR